MLIRRIRENSGWFVLRLIPLGLLFAAVYGLAGTLAAQRDTASLALSWEKAIPFVPMAIWLYLSIFIVFWLPLCVLERETIAWLMKRYVAVTLSAGLLFVAFPTAVGLERPETSGVHALLYAFDGPYNAAPSLHVAYAVLILWTCARALGGAARGAVITWLVLIVASTWLTHQHQLADIGAGVLLGGLSSLGSGAGALSDTGSMPMRHMRKYWET